MTERNIKESEKKEIHNPNEQKNTKKFLQTLTLIFLPLLWIGYIYSLYKGNYNNVLSYSCVIVAFSLINFNLLAGTKKAENKALNILAKVDGILFFTWAAILIISTILK